MDAVYGSSKQKLSAKDVEFIARYSELPVYVKGVQSEEDVERSLGAGASGIWVSNHGGRQLDGGPASFDSLQYVAKAVAGRAPIVLIAAFVAASMFSRRWHLALIWLR